MASTLRLRLLFGFMLLSLLGYTGWASLQQPVWEWGGLTTGPDRWWTIATLIDAYYGFLTFYAWVLYKERATIARLGWFVAIMLLGNMAMAAYVLRELARLAPGDTVATLLTRQNGPTTAQEGSVPGTVPSPASSRQGRP